MVPRPREQDPSGPDRDEPAAPLGRPGGFGRRVRPAGQPLADTPGSGVALSEVVLRIEDGLLMAFGPDGDPVPPAVFAAAARAQPEAQIRLDDGEMVASQRAAAVLEAQAKGPLTETGAPAADGWLRTMLGLGPQPATGPDEEPGDAGRLCELTAFARELMISMPAGGTFLVTEAGGAGGAAARLLLADGTALSVVDLIARVRAGLAPPAGPGAEGAAEPRAEVALAACGIRAAGEAVVLELPTIGSVRLADLAGAAADGPRVGLFLTTGAPATVADLIATLGGAERAAGAEPAGVAEPAPCSPGRPEAAGAAPDLSGWPETIAAAADGTADLGPLGAVLTAAGALSATVAGLPEGAGLSAGRRQEDGRWSLAAEELRGGPSLRLPPAGPRTCALEFTVRAPQGTAVRTVTVRRPETAAAPPEPAASTPAPAAATPEAGGASIRLAVRPPAGAGFAAREAALVIIGGVPAGGTLSAGIDNGDGSWMLSAADLVGLELSLPADRARELTLEVKALAVTSLAGEIASAAERVRLSLDPAARPLPVALDQTAIEGLQALMIRDLPPGARLSAGTYDPAIDAWVVLPRQLDGLRVTPADAAPFTLTVTGIARGADGRAATCPVARLPFAPA